MAVVPVFTGCLLEFSEARERVLQQFAGFSGEQCGKGHLLQRNNMLCLGNFKCFELRFTGQEGCLMELERQVKTDPKLPCLSSGCAGKSVKITRQVRELS